VMLAPAIKQNTNLQPFKQFLAAVLGYLMPRLKIAKLEPGLGCRNPAVNEHFYTDPLTHTGHIRAGTGLSLLKQCQKLQENLHQMKVPFLCLHGTRDKMIDPTGAQWLFERSAHLEDKDKQLKFYEGLWHDLIHDPEHEMVIDDCVKWILNRT
jgi:acylglycerol lipase